MLQRLTAVVLSVAILTGCQWPSQRDLNSDPSSQEFACEQIRSGASIQELVDHEQRRGVDRETIDAYLIRSVRDTCPEFALLIEEYYTD